MRNASERVPVDSWQEDAPSTGDRLESHYMKSLLAHLDESLPAGGLRLRVVEVGEGLPVPRSQRASAGICPDH
jgi:hypothetical protein